MIYGKKVLAIVMAGGEGSRLKPLTGLDSKPSVPFGGRHKIIDFVLSNLVNSNINSIYMLVQYRSQSLIDHVRKTWHTNPMMRDDFISVVPPQMQCGKEWYEGTADAVYQNLQLIENFNPDLVVVFGADHIYRMDVGQMIKFHLDHQADVTVASLPVPVSQSSSFGILKTAKHSRVLAFQEKPIHVESMPDNPGFTLASMGNYVFSADVLVDVLKQAHARGEKDFGHHVLPAMTETHRVAAYDFTDNIIPGMRAGEERGYWRDVGTIEAYFDAHFDTLGMNPKFSLQNQQWPIFGGCDQCDPSQIMNSMINNSSLNAGCTINGASLNGTILRKGVEVQADVELDRCIVMENTTIGKGARIRRAIIDQDNVIPAGMTIGFDPVADRERFHVSDSGIVVVARGQLR